MESRPEMAVVALAAATAVSLVFNIYNVTYAVRSRLIDRAAAATFAARKASLTPAERSRKLLQWSCWVDHATPRDLDWNMHVNNAKYLRKADLARIKLFGETGLAPSAKKLGAELVLGSVSIQFRKEVNAWDRIVVASRIVGWDTKTFFLEQLVLVPKTRDVAVNVSVVEELALHTAGSDGLASVVDAVGGATMIQATQAVVACAVFCRIHITGGQRAPVDLLRDLELDCPTTLAPPRDAFDWSDAVVRTGNRVLGRRPSPPAVQSKL